MEKAKKLTIAVELTNGDYHKIECSSIEYDRYGIEIWGKDTNASIKYEEISLLTIFVNDEESKDMLTFRAVKEPKVEREK